MILDHPVGRADYYDQLPAIFVDRPGVGRGHRQPGPHRGPRQRVRGDRSGRRSWTAPGNVIADQQVMASCGTGCWGTFRADLPYTVDTAQYGTLRVFDLSARDGVRGEPVRVPGLADAGGLTPAG